MFQRFGVKCMQIALASCRQRSVSFAFFSTVATTQQTAPSTKPIADIPDSTQVKTKKFTPYNERRRSPGKRNKGITYPVMNIYEVFTPLRTHALAKFDETVEIAVNLSVDPRKPNQSIKGVATLPSGTGKKIRVAVFAVGEDVQTALDAGADVAGSDELIKSIQAGDTNFERVIATPEMMAQVGKIGKILGPRGLMPNPKLGTVTKDVAKAVKSAKQGSVQFRVAKDGIIHAGIGKISFTNEGLLENIKSFMLALNDAKPEGYKGKYFKAVHISSTMGPGLKVDLASVDPSNPKFFVDPSKLKSD